MQGAQVPEEVQLWVCDVEGDEEALPVPSSVGSWVFRGHEDFAAVHKDLASAVVVAFPAVEAVVLADGGMAFPNCDREALPVCAETVALLVAWAGKLLQAPETCQGAQ